MVIEPFLQEGYQLLHQGAIELSRVEANGIRIHRRRLKEAIEEASQRLLKLRHAIITDPLWKHWRKRFGENANLASRDQLAHILYQELKYPVTRLTEKGRPSVDEEVLQEVDIPIIQRIGEYLKIEKILGTFLLGIQKEIAPDGRIHPVFNLHTARTYRSSSDSPNFQNFPVRDKEASRLVRSLFIPSKGCLLVENDFKGIEVVVSAAYHRDKNFISYIRDPKKDMHRDLAAQIYCLEPSQVTKDIRYGAKNKFVFPQFYGDFYKSCAKALWDWIRKGKLKAPDGRSLYDHLYDKGIRELGACDMEKEPVPGTFEYHVKQVEDDFWNRRFRDYGKWRKEWFQKYQERGYFDLLSGFRIQGFFPRNAVVNYPIQGSAFHCLLWSLIQINRRLRKAGLQSKIVGQIHDSIVADVVREELREYLCIVEDVTMRQLPRHFDWLVVAPQIEYEISYPERSWYGKQPFQFRDGHFVHPDHPKQITSEVKEFLRWSSTRNTDPNGSKTS